MSWSGHDPPFSRELGRRGWLGVTLPTAYGGGGRSPFARYVLVEEFLNFGAPVGAHWIADCQSAPLILKYGSEAQRQFYLPPICRGESFFCIGMSEPGAGSTLASVRTSEAALEVAALSHSIHGAIGFTAEFDLQLFTRRLYLWRQCGGSESYWHDVAGAALIESSPALALDLIRSGTDLS